MQVLVIGAGGREHAIAWRLAASPSVDAVHCAPGNPGMATLGTCHPVDATDPDSVVTLAQHLGADLVVIGPEAPLVAGVADALNQADIAVFGPTAAAAQLEGSKSFAKAVMAAAGVPTARYWTGDDPVAAKAALDDFDPPYVIKADGLAAGKGVVIADDRDAAETAIDAAMIDGQFGQAGSAIVIEAFLDGPECSLFGISDGTVVVPLSPAQDYKRAFDGDKGPNTGGMGAYSPVPDVDETLVDQLHRTVLQPMITQMAKDGTPFVGLLYAGLVLTPDGPNVIEFNARFGDPETQVVLPRLESDFGQLLYAAATGSLASVELPTFTNDAAVTVILASGGYPGSYSTGATITLPDDLGDDTVTVFHAGTASVDDVLVTAGGRVIAVTAMGPDCLTARDRAYAAADRITWDNQQRRNDIAGR